MIGNLIGDAVKGRQYEGLQPFVRKGVLMHRAIDDYTDRHPVNAEIRKLLHPEFGKYAGVYLDMFYDHFLAANWDNFCEDVSLQTFCTRFYFDAIFRHKYLPLKVKALLSSLIVGNRLRNYAYMHSMADSLEMMHKYSNLPKSGKEAIKSLEKNYDEIQKGFYEFFPLLVNHTRIWREEPERKEIQLPDLFLLKLNREVV